MLLFPYDARNRSLVEHFGLIGAGSNEKQNCKSIKCLAIGVDQVEAYEKMKKNSKL
jgi:hypothetical protein